MARRDDAAIRERVRAIVAAVIAPNAERVDREGVFPRENLEALAREGWNGVLLPEELGGLGLGHVEFAIATEEIGRACASTALVYVMHIGAAQTIALYGNDDQKERWLRPARRGLIGTYSTSEKASGGHWWFNFSEAKRDGDDYLVSADKSFTTSAGKADYYVLQTRTPGAKGPTDISFFIVDGKRPGIEAGRWDALGVQATAAGRSSAPSATRARRSPWGRPTTSRASGSANRSSDCRSSSSRPAESEPARARTEERNHE
ncbi:hypothetical protein BE17_50330 [Sorangium cellulosum]|uniref:Acyl-CoA dehydrogenase/oxidase N-terminal domain-containing protein n=1 Tax=Sorangium cellulosum TaxID=56 RepID=A0A150QYG2_SORCE|nr:hypothetical protein BE17_50330 [Sorangium cellulosum]